MDEQKCDYHQSFDPTLESLTVSLVRMVACYENQSVDDLPPLIRSVDPDALETILGRGWGQSSRGVTSVEFDYDEVHVRVSNTGDVWLWESNGATP